MLKHNKEAVTKILENLELEINKLSDKYPSQIDFEKMTFQVDLLRHDAEKEIEAIEKADEKERCSHPQAGQEKADFGETFCTDCGLTYGVC